MLACDKGLICCHGLLDDSSGIARGVMAFRGGASVIGGFWLVPFSCRRVCALSVERLVYKSFIKIPLLIVVVLFFVLRALLGARLRGVSGTLCSFRSSRGNACIGTLCFPGGLVMLTLD